MASVDLLTHVGRPGQQTGPLLISQGCYRSCLITSQLALGPLLARTLPFSEPYNLASLFFSHFPGSSVCEALAFPLNNNNKPGGRNAFFVARRQRTGALKYLMYT